MKVRLLNVAVAAGAALALGTGCAAPDVEESGVVEGEFSPPFAPGENAKEDRSGYTAIYAERYYYSTQVWEIRNQWEDRNTTEARKAGLAWGESSGMNWDEKFRAWVRSLRRIRGDAGWYDTFEVTTPYGKTLPAPALECAEVAMFLRVAFASWYGLPFFMESTDSRGLRTFLGHFGWRTASGRYGSTPLFKTAYKDYSGRDIARDGWPSDSGLRAKKLAGAQDDHQPFLGPDARFGTYLDELLLNKRVGHFLIRLLDYFGSVNLASAVNTYNLKAAAVSDGDVLVERWQRSGIGHTLVAKQVDRLPDGKLAVDLASGSMPRRQPKWEESAVSKSYFTSQYTGGPQMSQDGVAYSRLGGGLKRWRVTKRVNGYWQNTIMSADLSSWVNSTNYSAIEGRLVEFETLLGNPDPTVLRDALLRGIEDRRAHLSRFPASCSARTRREELFRELYAVMEQHFGASREETDRRYRKIDDYVFAELDYTKSKTCCWNSTTADMYQIILETARSRQNPSVCEPPPVFKATNGGYATFRDYAVATGRGALWREWSEDEPCSQRGVSNDTETAHDAAPYCAIFGPGGGGCVEDRFAGNQSRAAARSLGAGVHDNLQICSGADDWFKVSVPAGRSLRATVSFRHASGDIDVRLFDAAGSQVAASEGTGDTETVSAAAAGEYTLRVYGYNGAANAYRLEIALP
jgi:hypothetical protein